MKFGVLVSATFLFGSLSFGQGGPGHMGPGGGRGFGAFHSGKVIAGEPYSAQVTNTSVKTLTDGNTIQHTTTGFVARDSAGRTYTQETITGLWGQSGTKTMTFISDPVAGFVYSLNPQTKTATRRAIHVRSGEQGPQTRPANPNVVTAALGTQSVAGVMAEGKKTTRTVPAGAMGNTQPIVSTSEVWTAPNLSVVVSAVRTDPREGTSTYTLSNLQQAEPAATLFQVPSDYTVKDVASPQRGGAGAVQ